MVVNADEVDQIAATVADIYREAELALVRIIGRYLAGNLDSDAEAPQWAQEKLNDVGALRKAAQAVVTGLQGDSGGAITEAAAKAFRSGWQSAVTELPSAWFPKSGIGQAAKAATAETPGFAAVEALAAAVHRDIGIRSGNVLRDVVDAYREVITAATARTVTGTQTRRQASQAAWQRLMNRGISGFMDRSGRRWQLSSYVEMAVRTVTQRAAVQGQTDRLDTFGVSLVMASDHGQECALCRPFEGQVLALTGPAGQITVPHATRDSETVTVTVTATLDDARRAGFQHPNCRHSVSAYLPGVSRLPEQPTADPAGDLARQRQRELERRIRKAKVSEAGALTDQARTAARVKVRAAQTQLRDHLAANPKLKRLRYREQVGAGSIPPKGKGDPAGGIGAPVQSTLDGSAAVRPVRTPHASVGDVAQAARDAEADARRPGLGQLELGADPLAELDLSKLTDDEVSDLLGEHADDDLAVEQVLRELDRRQAVQDAAAERRDADRGRRERAKQQREEKQWNEFEKLLELGHDEESAVAEVFGRTVEQQRRDRAIASLRDQGYAGKGFDELARQAYRDHVYEQYIAAEGPTRGHMLTADGQARGINPQELFSGPESRARKWASDELKEWWDQNGRVTFDQYKSDLLGNTPGYRGSAGDGFLQ
ncbi:phage minor capsid protein [Amycolatopsis sp. H20-H5]|uniref:phage minor capsid protein n=1 Tax=Amycolatopsis sp. H20-H5 TaxID=3046309 RepID=UPI002DBE162C|nr:phage minor capsid protein [Amycolatopsis sp. H20-H5]MEC3977892.1 phage minor capsid protein [Amycolatopsis sp. H20-H5]